VQKIVIEIVVEIGMKQTRLFQCNRTGSIMPIFMTEIVIEFFRKGAARSGKILTEIGKKINNRTNTAISV